VPVNTLVEELRELISTDAVLHGVELSLELAPRLPDVVVDAGQVQQVILNFVRNSLEALAGARPETTPRVAISTSAAGDGTVELMVCDNGPGLAPELTKRIFDPFFSTKENGTGLGLAISSTIARAHGGSVGYRPNLPAGACFHIRLPTQARE
jgi:signal transduction histidine kinase